MIPIENVIFAVCGVGLIVLLALLRPLIKAAASADVRKAWDMLGGSYMGRWLLSFLIGFSSPYSGNLGAMVQEISNDTAVVSLVEKRSLRNPFKSVHAAAVVNLAEMTSGLVVLYALTARSDGLHGRGIVKSLQAEYIAKARGRLTATAVPSKKLQELPTGSHVVDVIINVTNAESKVVAKVSVKWMCNIGESKQKAA